MTCKNAKTILFASLIAVMILSFSMVDDSYADVEKSDKGELTREEQINQHEDRAFEILQELGGYDKYLELINSDNKSSLKDEINSMHSKMAEFGIMTLEEFNDPQKRMQFYLDHPEIIEDTHDVHQTSYVEISHNGCNCGPTQVKSVMGYHYPFAWWSYDAYLLPTSWQTLYPNIVYESDNDNINVSHDWIEPFIKAYTTQSGVQQIDGFASVDVFPPYDDELSETRYFTQNIIKTFDFDRYDNGIDSSTYVWGTTTWVSPPS